MYGMPDTIIGNSARKAIRMAKRADRATYPSGWSGTVARWLNRNEAKKLEQFRLERLERKHKVKFI